jgi:hypothetical protein
MDRADGAGEPEDDPVSSKGISKSDSDTAQGMGRWHLRRRGFLHCL